jgi:hypothetical protein
MRVARVETENKEIKDLLARKSCMPAGTISPHIGSMIS